MSLSGILDEFETRQKQFFHIFGAKEKIRNFFFPGKIGFFRKKSVFYRENRYLSEKSAIFLRFFYFRFFHRKSFPAPPKIDFLHKNRSKKPIFLSMADLLQICNEITTTLAYSLSFYFWDLATKLATDVKFVAI